jgi:hypothetical protein
MARCMQEIKPDYVIEEIKKTGWLKKAPSVPKKFIVSLDK